MIFAVFCKSGLMGSSGVEVREDNLDNEREVDELGEIVRGWK